MDNTGQNVFSKVDTRSERQRAYNLLVDTKEEVQVQLPNKELVRCRPMFLKDSRLLLAPLIDPKMDTKVEAIVTFDVGQEKYFLKTTLHRQGHDFYFIDIDAPLFKLQRRNSFRVTIPAGYGARVVITELNGAATEIKLSLADLSSGGFSFETNSKMNFNFKSNDKLRGNIIVGGKFNKTFEAVIRHVASFGSKGSGLTRLGVEFVNMSGIDREAFMKVTMELHRDMFSTFKIASR